MIDKLAWIEVHQKQILSTKSYGKDKYYIPGGKSDAAALCREIREELSINLREETFNFVGTFQAQAHGHPFGTLVNMTCYTALYDGTLKAANEIEEIKWLTYLDKELVSDVDKKIFDFLHAKGLL
jgi:8-oxo-dGTP diphosphatase